MSVAIGVAVSLTASLAHAVQEPHDGIVGANPVNWTPHALDGDVKAITEVGSTVVVGGNFTRIAPADSSSEIQQRSVFAFDAGTGNLRTAFDPDVVGGEVNSIVAHPDGDKVWIGGAFSDVNGVRSKSLALVSLSTGDTVAGFNVPAMNGRIKDMRLVGGRLLISGTWSAIGGTAQGYLAALDPATGRFDPFIDLTFSGLHNGGHTAVIKFDVSPDGSRLVAIGNFTHVNGQRREQIAVVELLGSRARLADWHTARFEPTCSRSFDTYMRDVDIDPTGMYFALATTGAYSGGPPKLCDSASRWELGVRGSNQQPTWVDYTGGDTLWSVGVTGAAVYVGGHQRWQNNPFSGDRAGPGAVEREGLAALDPLNGVPFSWNPGRDRGVGVYELTGTDAGLWVGSDTDRIGRFEYHGRLAMFPLDEGTAVPPSYTGELPGRLISIGTTVSDTVIVRNYNGSVTGETTLPPDGTAWRNLRGGTMISGRLYHGWSNGTFSVRNWNGTSFGPATTIPNNGLSDWANDVSGMTGLFFLNGRLYFTRSNSATLYSRYFTPESGIVGAERFAASGNVAGIDFSLVSGMTLAGNHLYWAHLLDGTLRRTNFVDGRPVPNTTVTVGGPLVDGRDWRARDLVLEAQAGGIPANVGPRAFASAVCEGATCHFGSGGSGDPDGTVASVVWDFGDGTTGTGSPVSHTYTSEAPRTVTLTVTDDDGASATDTWTVQPFTDPTASFTVACSELVCTFDGSASHDGGAPVVSYAWDFGDGGSATGATPSHTYASAGTYTASLTVTDDEGATGTATRYVSVVPIQHEVSFVGVASTSANSSAPSVSVPSGALPGDALVLIATVNRADITIGEPGSPEAPGAWQPQGTVVDLDMTTTVWSRIADQSDVGATVTVPLSGTAKADLQLLVYRGTHTTQPVAQAVLAAEPGFSAFHTTPTATAPEDAWVVSYWADKTSETTSWAAPGGVTQRSSTIGIGGGRITSLTADSGGPVAAGTVGGLTATASSESGKATMLTIVLAPREA
ncbi:MAG: PKD domain-containing protein [Acidimicrobiales bacterium]